MRRSVVLSLLFAMAVWAANVRLYLKDGDFHVVREYQVVEDRVRYYSVERGDWEEIPLSLVDLKRTEREAAEHKDQVDKDAKALSEEVAALRAIDQEAARIPREPGAYWLEGSQTKSLKLAPVEIHIDKKRRMLKVLAPIGQAINGKGTLEIAGTHSANVFSTPEQEFYLQLAAPERFGIAKLTVKGDLRIVESLVYLPFDGGVEETPTLVDTLQHEMDPAEMYKIWPKAPLPDGEYAVVEYAPDAMNMQVWDFAIQRKPAGK